MPRPGGAWLNARMRQLLPWLVLTCVTSSPACDKEAPPPTSTATTLAAPAVDRVKVASHHLDPKTGAIEVTFEGKPGAVFVIGDSSRLREDTPGVEHTLGADGKLTVPYERGGVTAVEAFLLFTGSLGEFDALKASRKRSDPRLEEAQIQLPPVIMDDRRLQSMKCASPVSCRVALRLFKDAFEVQGPAGATLRVGAQEVALTGQAQEVKPDYAALVGAMDLAATFGSDRADAKLALPVSIEKGDELVAFGTYTLSGVTLDNLAGRLFREVRNGPLKVGAEGTGRATMWIERPDGPTDSTARLVGEAKTLGDVGFVALSKTTPGASRPCGTYEGGGASASVAVTAYGQEVALYDRRTGAKVAEQSFAPPTSCPSQVGARAGATFVSSGAFVDEAAIIDWIASQTRAP